MLVTHEMHNWLRLAWSASIRTRAIRMALFIGTLLALINHGDALLSGHIAAPQFARIALTYLVPYCLSTWASVQATRHLQATASSREI